MSFGIRSVGSPVVRFAASDRPAQNLPKESFVEDPQKPAKEEPKPELSPETRRMEWAKAQAEALKNLITVLRGGGHH